MLPVLLLLGFTVVQFALFHFAARTALAAADEGLRAARTEPGPAQGRAAGRERAEQHLAALGGDLLHGEVVAVDSDGVTAQVTVTGRSISLVPGLTLQVSETAAGRVERFRAG